MEHRVRVIKTSLLLNRIQQKNKNNLWATLLYGFYPSANYNSSSTAFSKSAQADEPNLIILMLIHTYRTTKMGMPANICAYKQQSLIEISTADQNIDTNLPSGST